MKLILFISITLFLQDSTFSSEDSSAAKSILFINEMENYQLNKANIRYNYKQGFFCDFEDKISNNKKMRINLGLDGKQ